jgi:hypothetical protein
MGDDLDAMNARMVREQGMREVRESGFRGRLDRTNGAGKLRKRSLSRGLRDSAGGGLERVDEGRELDVNY